MIKKMIFIIVISCGCVMINTFRDYPVAKAIYIDAHNLKNLSLVEKGVMLERVKRATYECAIQLGEEDRLMCYGLVNQAEILIKNSI